MLFFRGQGDKRQVGSIGGRSMDWGSTTARRGHSWCNNQEKQRGRDEVWQLCESLVFSLKQTPPGRLGALNQVMD
ncbi:hypothetical protein E2C01_069603 [Portunus trituberculatus]|uniref:Uncharacterized protein n=1 Tax=Portunus trituberculatus TaxID=210409 RepID=A0A5B7I006_PORTR|nr:hypothetical protein [Portunus trituberculatus]